MSWPIRLHAERPLNPKIGDMWPNPWMLEEPFFLRRLSPAYLAKKHERAPLVVRLPGSTEFCIDTLAWRDGQVYGNGWTVTGEAPRVTLSPSINIVGSYHGWIRDGVITDDCEGRSYGAADTA